MGILPKHAGVRAKTCADPDGILTDPEFLWGWAESLGKWIF